MYQGESSTLAAVPPSYTEITLNGLCSPDAATVDTQPRPGTR